MKLYRNDNDDGLGKYALINLRKLNALCGNPSTFQRWTPQIQFALDTLSEAGVIEWGRVGDDDEFFVVKLKDVNAPSALQGYAANAALTDAEFAEEVMAMAFRAEKHPARKRPD